MSLIDTIPLEPLPAVPFPTVIDSSMMGTFKSCPREFYYQYLRHLRGFDQSVHLVAGAAFADGIEAARLLLWSPNPPSFDECIYRAQIAAIKAYGDFETPEGNNKTLGAVCLAIEAYFLHHGVHDDVIQPYMHTTADGSIRPGAEFTFAMPTGIPHPETGEDILYVGRFDMFGERKIGSTKQLFVVDEKSTTQLGNQWLKQWDLRSQFTGYCWAAQEYGYPVGGAIVRGVSFLKNDFGFAEVITYRKAHEINAWKHAMRKYILRLIDCWKTMDFEQQFDSACTAYSGCDYGILCKTKNPERWIEPNYVIRKWEPLMVKG